MKRGDPDRAKRRGWSVVFGVVLTWAFVSWGCESLSFLEDFYPAKGNEPMVLETDSKITLITSRFPPDEIPTYYSAADRFLMEFYFDPMLVHVADVRGIVLWRAKAPEHRWERFFTVSRQQIPKVLKGLDEGEYGLRSSVIFNDGRQAAVPLVGDHPLVRLVIDRTPPKLDWLFPLDGGRLAANTRVTLRWGAAEKEFGNRSTRVEWSADAGQTWTTVGLARARAGVNVLRWKTPPTNVEDCRLRIVARDIVGNESRAEISTRIDRPLPQAEPERVDVPVEDIVDATRTKSTGDAVIARTEPETPGTARIGRGRTPLLDGLPEPRPALANGSGSIGTEPTAFSPEPVATAGIASAPPSRVGSLTDSAGAPDRASGGLRLLNFDDGATQRGGTTRYVFFQAGGLSPAARLSLEWSESSDGAWTLLSASLRARDSKYLWRLPEKSVTDGRLRLSTVDAAGKTLSVTSRKGIRIDNETPLTEIIGVQRDEAGEPFARINCFDRGPAGLAEVKLFLTRDGGVSWAALEVSDPTEPVSLPALDGSLGLWLYARDQVGWETPRPTPGAVPQRVFQGARTVQLTLEDPESKVLRGGEEFSLRWSHVGEIPAQALLAIEISANGGADWELLKRVPLARGHALVVLPARDGSFVFRARADFSGGFSGESRTRPFRVDASPPQLKAGPFPRRSGVDLSFPILANDLGAAGLEGVSVHVRRGGEREWTVLHDDRLSRDAGRGHLSLRDLSEGEWEIYLAARDRVGNRSPDPAADSVVHGKFYLDRTPPAMEILPTAFAWVEGQPAFLQVKIDRSDAIAPLMLERQLSEGHWEELYRWSNLPPEEDLYRFRVPVGARDIRLRLSVRDAVGNRAYVGLEPRTVEPAITLESLRDGGEYVAGTNLSLSWTLHPSLSELAEEFKVEVAYRHDSEKSWHQIYDGLSASGSCVWTLPHSAPVGCFLRLRLFHQGTVIGETASTRAFYIRANDQGHSRKHGRGATQAVAPIADESLEFSERAWIQMKKYDRNRGEFSAWYGSVTAALKKDPKTGKVLEGEWQKLERDVWNKIVAHQGMLRESYDKISANFKAALERDSNNFHASYGLALLILNNEPTRAREAIELLKRTVELKPDHVDALNDLGASLIRIDDYAAAEKVLQGALEHREHLEIRYNLGLALFYQRKIPGARTQFEKVARTGGIPGRQGELYYYLIVSLLHDGDRDTARRYFERHQASMPKTLQLALKSQL